ncbi:MAG: methylmalonyl Co-A mutase-associated GTPase MeaB [Alphaproteobacteria bacterium]|nr:methylmalonyl Co-A mutase-associated GTPase MeaB [Alphaproteobacteria bacterium]
MSVATPAPRPEPKGPDARAIVAGDRRALARAITLIESTRADHRRRAEALLDALLPHTGRSIRLGISGPPGVGKSTFIDALGRHLIALGRRVAVLAVDPSSKVSGGSILGDKTRMAHLTESRTAFVRPSPTAGTLGGVARRTREAMLACEAAGFDAILVETVGVGQSETAVADMVDMFMLLLLPAGGDELQGIKRGIVEMADLLVVNKADGELAEAAKRTAGDYASAVHMLRPASTHWSVPVLTCSALNATGIDAVWAAVERYVAALAKSGEIERRRARQSREWLWNEVNETLRAALKAHPGVRAMVGELEAKVTAGTLAPPAAARLLLDAFLGRGS